MLAVNLKDKTIKIRGTLEENFPRISNFWKNNPSLVNWAEGFKFNRVVLCPIAGPAEGDNWKRSGYTANKNWTIVNIDEELAQSH